MRRYRSTPASISSALFLRGQLKPTLSPYAHSFFMPAPIQYSRSLKGSSSNPQKNRRQDLVAPVDQNWSHSLSRARGRHKPGTKRCSRDLNLGSSASHGLESLPLPCVSAWCSRVWFSQFPWLALNLSPCVPSRSEKSLEEVWKRCGRGVPIYDPRHFPNQRILSLQTTRGSIFHIEEQRPAAVLGHCLHFFWSLPNQIRVSTSYSGLAKMGTQSMHFFAPNRLESYNES